MEDHINSGTFKGFTDEELQYFWNGDTSHQKEDNVDDNKGNED